MKKTARTYKLSLLAALLFAAHAASAVQPIIQKMTESGNISLTPQTLSRTLSNARPQVSPQILPVLPGRSRQITNIAQPSQSGFLIPLPQLMAQPGPAQIQFPSAPLRPIPQVPVTAPSIQLPQNPTPQFQARVPEPSFPIPQGPPAVIQGPRANLSSAASEDIPEPPKRPSAASREYIPQPAKRPHFDSDDQKTEASVAPGTAGSRYCPYPDGRCFKKHNDLATPIKASQIAGLSNQGKYHMSAQEVCYSQNLLEAAKVNVRENFNRDHSVGKCALGVRTSINRAGISQNSFGDAIDFHARGKLSAIGFKNIISQVSSPYDAPPGAVLVFAGPNTAEYLRDGNEGGTSLGDSLGHVTIKGDDGHFYTDGRTVDPAIGWPSNKTHRRIVGIYVMDHCTESCLPRLRNKCG